MLRQFLIAAAMTLAASVPRAEAAATFSTGFDTTVLNPNLFISGSATLSGGLAGNGPLVGQTVLRQTNGVSSDAFRTYVETMDADYNTIDFTARLTFSTIASGGGQHLLFFGFGSVPPVNVNTEPGLGRFMRIHPGNFTGVDGLLTRVGNVDVVGSATSGPNVEAGVHTAQITKSGNLLSFQIDLLNNGIFVPFGGGAIDLSTPTYSFLNSSNSRLFFGTGTNLSEFDSFSVTSTSVTAAPEPASLALLGFGLSGIIAARRVRRRVPA